MKPIPRRLAASTLHCEQLEDRVVPTVLLARDYQHVAVIVMDRYDLREIQIVDPAGFEEWVDAKLAGKGSIGGWVDITDEMNAPDEWLNRVVVLGDVNPIYDPWICHYVGLPYLGIPTDFATTSASGSADGAPSMDIPIPPSDMTFSSSVSLPSSPALLETISPEPAIVTADSSTSAVEPIIALLQPVETVRFVIPAQYAPLSEVPLPKATIDSPQLEASPVALPPVLAEVAATLPVGLETLELTAELPLV